MYGLSSNVLPPAGLKLAVCLVNVSCGRQPAVVSQLAAAALRVTAELRGGHQPALCDAEAAVQLMERHRLPAAATVLSIFSDEDYDRTVLTVAAPLATLGASVLALCREACELVDLRQHQGNHPCLGAVDLVPVHPLTDDATLHECAQLATAVGQRLTEEVAGAACFWFGEADTQRRPLPLRRRQVGWFRRRPVAEEIDIGTPDPRLGVTGVGAIPYMTNFNVTLDSADLRLGRLIAGQLRATAPGGLPGVQAMAFHHQGRVEVGCNLDFVPEKGTQPGDGPRAPAGHRTPTETVERRAAELAGRYGVSLMSGSKIIGFTPERAAQLAWSALSRGDGEAWRAGDRASM